MEVFERDDLLRTFPVSTALNGTGFQEGSHQTPLGRFEIAEKIGDQLPVGTIFESRTPVGMWDGKQPTDDNNGELILTRILWLNGLDEENANTKQRYIYIHGTNHEKLVGRPVSHGCVRLRNEDVVTLFDCVPESTIVVIE